jgi:DNA replication and repair protein RecF
MLSSLAPYLKGYYREISGGKESVDIAYVPSWQRKSFDLEAVPPVEPVSRAVAQTCLSDAMEQAAEREHERHASLFGPQLDLVEFYLDGRNAQQFASQGQQRSLVLAFKMAQVSLIADRLGQNPVLLLDDVMSELDASRRDALLSLISGEVQTFVTATNAESVTSELSRSARIVTIGDEQHG